MTYKIICDLSFSDLSDCIFPYKLCQVLRSLGEVFVSLLPPSQTHLVKTPEMAFLAVVSKLWPRESRMSPPLPVIFLLADKDFSVHARF